MSRHIVIIAEAGVNHNGDFEMARQLVLKAREAGADYVKFQTAVPNLVISRYAEMAEYQKANTRRVESQLEMCRRIHLGLDAYAPLKAFCDQVGIGFVSTPFDLVSIDTLEPLGMDFWKIPSGEVTNYPYLVRIAGTHRPVVMSTGMCEMREIREAVRVLTDNGTPKDLITLLHCNTEYPTPYEDVNLRAMETMSRELGLRVGYSDHSLGLEVPVAAAALGATVIEKHFTLDRRLPGPDHRASLEPSELKAMVLAVRHVEQALGDGKKRVSPSERRNLTVARKSLTAQRDIHKGEILTWENLTCKRPGSGISPMRWNEVLGTAAVRDFKEDEMIEL